jgi:hypothetical protein
MARTKGLRTKVRRLQPDGIHNPEDYALHASRSATEHASWVLDYLRSATVFIHSPGIVRDASDVARIAGTGSILTDGVWAWSDVLGYYVERYGVALPVAFMEHARIHPLQQLSPASLRALELIPEEW